MYSAKQINNFQAQNTSFSAKRRIHVERPPVKLGENVSPFGFPSPQDVGGGIKFVSDPSTLGGGASQLNQYTAMFPCIISPAMQHIMSVGQEPTPDSNGLQAPYGNARGTPKSIRGIASVPKRDALLAMPVRTSVSVNSQLAPMMMKV